MPKLTRLSRSQEMRLERLIAHTGLERSVLIEQLVANGLSQLETEHFGDDMMLSGGRTIDQLLRESGLGA
ncbi:hypothetical protein [Halomonas halocynthiae]|uniref:hypothetical protein n=1 Tax=Halomonas TaxID=2745 RepID=UPI00040EB9B2|nr:hypothetical protein [Halomonas halocynthiae]